jgi:hypothetical protein
MTISNNRQWCQNDSPTNFIWILKNNYCLIINFIVCLNQNLDKLSAGNHIH